MSKNRKVVQSFDFGSEAQVLKSRLESEGIEVFLRDEAILTNDPFISEAIGGVKLEVYEADYERAKSIWDELRIYATDEEGRPLQCPNCGACKYEAVYLEKSWFYRLFPFFQDPVYECQQCGTRSRNPQPKADDDE